MERLQDLSPIEALIMELRDPEQLWAFEYTTDDNGQERELATRLINIFIHFYVSFWISSYRGSLLLYILLLWNLSYVILFAILYRFNIAYELLHLRISDGLSTFQSTSSFQALL
jgi:hypothetical protein